MLATLHFEDGDLQVDFSSPTSIAIAMGFNDAPQPRAFGLSKASQSPFSTPTFTTEVRQGGAINCMQLTIWPHGNGTHTETMGHLLENPPSIGLLTPQPQVAIVLSVSPEKLSDTTDSYPEPASPEDSIISLNSLRKAFNQREATSPHRPTALIIRTLPNNAHHKQQRDYSNTNPTYLSNEAMHWIRHELHIEHLLLDLPSVDRENDHGMLSNHRIYWDIPTHKTVAADDNTRTHCTITEMILVPDGLPDGLYILALQFPALLTDATPSRPLLYPIVG